jgi:hypothetical protein
MRKLIRYILAGLLVIAVAIQFYRPEHLNPPIDSTREISGMPPDVRGALDRACFDCHSNRTFWPWYSEVAPVSWLVAADVRQGRRHLNFSEWQGYPIGKQIAKLDDLIGEIDKESMPPGQYLLMHREARLSPEERERIVKWASAIGDSLESAKGSGK